MPVESYGRETDNMLDATAQEFDVEEYGWHCKLAFEGDKDGRY